jgi:hypothetical protein
MSRGASLDWRMYPILAIQEALGDNLSGGFLLASAFLPMPSVAESKVDMGRWSADVVF